MLSDDVRLACLPLFEAGQVQVLEWSFDTVWPGTVPEWARALLAAYADAGKLLGHGVTLSLLSGRWSPRHAWWLEQVAAECSERSYRHVSEHFGFMTAGPFTRSAPLPVPFTQPVVQLGQDRLKRLADVTNAPVGLENLAFAFGREDVDRHGAFLDRLLDPVDGFLVLDLHNLYCQVENFNTPPDRLLDAYPLDRVRELHVSGGSWSESTVSEHQIRRDTHDAEVPEPVFELVDLALARCPNVEAVIFERLAGTVSTPGAAEQLQIDYRRLYDKVTQDANT